MLRFVPEIVSNEIATPARADARRNRRRLLDAAIELTLEIGGDPSRDAVAQRAGVGIGTLYRHFPDRQSLLRAVVLDVLDRTIDEGNAALAESATGGEALRRYLHAAIDHGLGVVNVVHGLLDTTDWPDRRAAAHDMLDRLVAIARRDGALDHDVTAADIALATIRFCRPLAIGLAVTDERAVAHRQLDTYLDGLAVRS
jgi:AcrR family transcriptional regulator